MTPRSGRSSGRPRRLTGADYVALIGVLLAVLVFVALGALVWLNGG